MEMSTGRTARPARQLLKYALVGFVVLTLAIGGTIAYLVLTFDPRDHHARIVDFVKEKTGRTLDIKGRIELSFWPDLGVRLGALTLSERDSSETFASIESARLRIALQPLLERELVVDEVVLVGANVNIVRFENGRLNLDDLLQGDGGTPQFDIGRVSVERSAIVYRDLSSGAEYVADTLELETGRLANDVVTPVRLAFRLHDENGNFAVTSALQGRLGLDLVDRRYALEGATLEVNGRVPGMDDLALRATGNAMFARAANELLVRSLAATLAGTYGQDHVELAMDAASLRLVPQHATAETLRMSVVAEGPAGTTDIRLSSPVLARAEDRITADALALDMALERGGHRVKAAIAAALDAQIAARTLMLSGMSADFSATGPRLPGKGVAGAVHGDARLDLAREGVQLDLTGKVARSRVKARLTSAGFASPVYTFAIDVDRLDLDRYLGGGARSRASREAALGGRINLLAPLANLPATGSLDVGVLTVAGTQARNVRLMLQ